MKTAFFASDPIALGAIEMLRDSKDFPLACIVSNPDRPKGRGKKVSPNEVSEWAMSNGVELLRPENGPDDACASRLRELGVELIAVMAYGCILKKNILEYGEYPCLNLHGSLLPELRGASPIETAIALGMEKTGVSLMRIEPKMDTGAVCASVGIDIAESDTSHTLRAKFRVASAELLKANIGGVVSGAARFVPQDDSRATYTRKLNRDDMRLDFSLSAKILSARIRAFGKGYFDVDGETMATDSAFAEDGFGVSVRAGEILEASSSGLRVACGKGVLRIATLQCPCSKMLPAREFFLGKKIRDNFIASVKNKSLLRNI